MTRPKVTPEQRQQVIDLYRQGNSVNDCCDLTGISHSQVLRIVRVAGIVRKRGGPNNLKPPLPAEVREEITALYLDGLSIKRCAEKVGLPATRVYAVLKEKGVVRPRNGADRRSTWKRSA